MSDTSTARRKARYHSPLRKRQAAETRRSVVMAAHDLFWVHGWAATTIPMIAAAAGVSVDSVHTIFGSKSALLMEVVEVALVGDDGETAMIDRADFALVGRGRRPERLRTGVRYAVAAYLRSIPILDTLREASASDDASRARLARYQEDRRDLMAAGMALVLGHDPTPEVVDAVWALVSPEVVAHLTTGRGWSSEQVEEWLVQMVQAALKQAHR